MILGSTASKLLLRCGLAHSSVSVGRWNLGEAPASRQSRDKNTKNLGRHLYMGGGVSQGLIQAQHTVIFLKAQWKWNPAGGKLCVYVCMYKNLAKYSCYSIVAIAYTVQLLRCADHKGSHAPSFWMVNPVKNRMWSITRHMWLHFNGPSCFLKKSNFINYWPLPLTVDFVLK